MYYLAIIGLLSTVIAFYYLRIIKIIYFDKEKDIYDSNQNTGLKLSLFLNHNNFIIFYLSKCTIRYSIKNSYYIDEI